MQNGKYQHIVKPKKRRPWQEGKKTTKAEHHLRVLNVYQLITQGYSRQEIIQYAREIWGRQNPSSVDKYIKRAHEWIKRNAEKDATEGLYESIAIRKRIMLKAFKKDDLTIAHDVIKDLDRLLDKYPSEKHEIKAIEPFNIVVKQAKNADS